MLWSGALAWRRDGTQLASGGRDGAVRVWSRDGALAHTLQDRGFVYCTSWSPDGTALVACVGDAAVVWDARTALPRVRLQGHGTSVFQASLIGDGAELLSAGGDGNVKRWTTATAFQVVPDAHASELRRVLPCDGGTTWLTLGEDGTLRAWNAGGAPRWTSPATLKIADVACAPTGSRMWLVTNDGRLHQATHLDQPPTAMAGVPTLAPGVAGTPLLALDPGATRLAMLDGAMTLRVLDLATGALATGAAPTLVADGPTLRWTSDGRALLGANDRGVVVWDPSGQVRAEVPFTGTEFRGATPACRHPPCGR